ncbi:MAG TPA: hypothetical protein VFU46_10435 [Gemmatimonadales bacterium]|nr:hypothetical protein [Gemmatimonadales bacterium]
MRMLRLLALLAAAPSAALHPQDRRLADRLDPVTATSVQYLVDSARGLGLPTEALVQKALEGRTLGAGGERIRAAVGALLGQLGRARDALGPSASEPELTAAAGALRAGLPGEILQRLRALRSGRSLVVPISVLTDLVAEGMTPELATRSVLDLARDGRPDDDFVALRRRAQMQLRNGGREPGPPGRPPARPAADPPAGRALPNPPASHPADQAAEP